MPRRLKYQALNITLGYLAQVEPVVISPPECRRPLAVLRPARQNPSPQYHTTVAALLELELAGVGEAVVRAAYSHDDVVEHRYAEYPPDLLEPACDAPVLVLPKRAAAGGVVHADA